MRRVPAPIRRQATLFLLFPLILLQFHISCVLTAFSNYFPLRSQDIPPDIDVSIQIYLFLIKRAVLSFGESSQSSSDSSGLTNTLGADCLCVYISVLINMPKTCIVFYASYFQPVYIMMFAFLLMNIHATYLPPSSVQTSLPT